MRLYPAGWAFERYASESTSLGGEPLKKGSRFLISPYLLHRNPKIWKNPEAFDPERFRVSITAPPGIPKYGFLPFGAGPRSCIGARMAWNEMALILKRILTHCSWKFESPADGSPLKPEGSFKIRLNQPLQVPP